MRLRVRFTLLVIFGFITLCSGQYLSYSLLEGKSSEKIPFQYVNGFITIEVVVQHRLPLNFIIDTGAKNVIIFDQLIGETLGLVYQKDIDLAGADLQEVIKGKIARNVTLQLPNVKQVDKDIIVLQEDFISISEIVGMPIHGIIGASFFKNLILEIDFKHSYITVHDPNSFSEKKIKNHHVFDIDIIDNKPYIGIKSCIVGQDTLHLNMLLDTGAALSVLLQSNSDVSIVKPSHTIPADLGRGLGGTVQGFIGNISYLGLGSLTFHNCLTYFQDSDLNKLEGAVSLRQGMLGTHFLERFHVVFNFLEHKLYLKPSKNYNQAFEYDRSGMTLYAYGPQLNHYVVKSVLPNSPASEAGILPGDELTKIGWWGSSNFTLQQVTNKLSGKVGKSISLKFKRNDQSYKVKIKLRNLI